MNSIPHPPGSGDAPSDVTPKTPKTSNDDAREKLMNEMKNVIDEAETWLGNAASQTGEDLRAVREKFETTLQTAKADLMKLEANMMDKTKLAAQATDAYVKDHPWKSVGLGAAVGVLLGLLSMRK